MKILIEQAVLHKAITRAISVVESRNTIPILSNVLIRAEGGEIWLTATDLNIETRVRVVGTIEREGATTVGASLLGDIVRNAPAGAEISLELNSDDPRMQVRFGRSRYQTPTLPAQDFPQRPPAEALTLIPIGAVAFSAMLDRTAFAMANDEIRHYLNGVYLHRIVTPGVAAMVRVVATCTGRLASAQQVEEADAPHFHGVIIPRKTVAEFTKALAGRVGRIELGVTASEVALDLGDQVIRSKIVSGDYVQYDRVVPTGWTHEIVVDRALLAAAARRVALVSTDKVKAVQLIAEDGVLTLQARSLDAGHGVEQIDVDGDPSPIDLAFNARFLLEALDQTDAERIAIRSGEKGSPVRLEPPADDPEADEVLSILMPMAI